MVASLDCSSCLFALVTLHVKLGSLANPREDVLDSSAALTTYGNFMGAEAHYGFRSVRNSPAGGVLAHTAVSGTAYTLDSVIIGNESVS